MIIRDIIGIIVTIAIGFSICVSILFAGTEVSSPVGLSMPNIIPQSDNLIHQYELPLLIFTFGCVVVTTLFIMLSKDKYRD